MTILPRTIYNFNILYWNSILFRCKSFFKNVYKRNIWEYCSIVSNHRLRVPPRSHKFREASNNNYYCFSILFLLRKTPPDPRIRLNRALNSVFHRIVTTRAYHLYCTTTSLHVIRFTMSFDTYKLNDTDNKIQLIHVHMCELIPVSDNKVDRVKHITTNISFKILTLRRLGIDCILIPQTLSLIFILK